MPDESVPVFRVDSAGVKLVEAARNSARSSDGESGINTWLHAVARHSPTMLYELSPGLNPADLRRFAEEEIKVGRIGDSAPEPLVLQAAQRVAAAYQKTDIGVREICAAVLILSGRRVVGPPSVLTRADLLPTGGANAAKITSTLDELGVDLTAAARDGEIRECVGREEELQTIVEVLLRSTKRNPVLVGPPGVGKTALAEGLALRIVNGEVPSLLSNTRLVAIHPGALLLGVESNSDLQARVKQLVEEASAGDVILFMDEIHSLVGMGGEEGRTDLATLLKPALARGDIAVLAATTDEEFRRFIQEDGALERRFQPIRINEPNREVVLAVLRERAREFEMSRGVVIDADDLEWLYDFAQRFLRSRYFPDKAIDLLEQAVARALASGSTSVSNAMAREVAERLVGMPVSVPKRVESLRVELQHRGVLGVREIESITEGVHVRMRGFGVNPLRPNAVILLMGEAVSAVDVLCETLAECLYGSEERVIEVDFSRLSDPGSVTLLLGAPPSYVGYKESIPLHELLQTPWSVVKLLNVDHSHPFVRAVLETALRDGYFTDGTGHRIHLSDSVVVVTVHATDIPEAATPRKRAERVLDSSLVSACDVVVDELPQDGQIFRRWFERDLLAELTARFERKGLTIKWHASMLEWLHSLKQTCDSPLELQREMDCTLALALMQYLPEDSGVDVVSVGWVEGQLVVEPLPADSALSEQSATPSSQDG